MVEFAVGVGAVTFETGFGGICWAPEREKPIIQITEITITSTARNLFFVNITNYYFKLSLIAR